ncbi:cAMP-regulated phosphoprotein 21 isoform X1 [Phyllostomus hastatus]|uniref:cAMP-regulated phosphoprotein 21 isoform X1 n=1 Tax=Phyllostomus hastatus TaxID=9423 RepID=UPI001E682690|nr:cAMP-regulated phosphoprotein 21 isoform X1 [Phyllostomus hastatus]XP_045713032.1 cAMP-regulated phosphoprotein 21 isoform X1 [Phyllostomus hastatus]XP_045713033.1 cAMP-regulated phosphoprotein 21 isoform X1 [Phyllostomus hastatus]XP_045713034.1 cAMP-regulated phosphoprotein 21 isoform X1 [Phyllostomus hastatus]XP_045713035.1 cAMP-regulated phosphoprotein 21 isoform X1 [Phyllostomus hastatus]XP_045713036.1 cAMP-regulated phosphoprotein 21 isoform X1 [Phyllostomus hastatus]XP_045713037.1 cA
MSEPGDLSQAIVEEGGTEQGRATPENGIVKSESLDEEEKLELQRRLAAQNQERRKSKSGAGKGKLTRSLAVCEESSARPGGENLQDQESIHLQLSSFPSLQEDDKSRKDDTEREKEKDKNKDKSSEKPKIRMLSKDCSQEYTDSTGIDLHEFLINTLKNNSRDRMILLKMEQEIIDFIGDNNNHYKKFPQMSSYQRMLVHRVAAYFGLDHNVDQTGKSVIINKTSSTRIPEQRFCEHLKDEKGEESQKRFILKRDNSSIDKEDNQQNRMHPFRDDRRSKSIEEREEEYQRVRERIFAHDSVCSQESLFVENSRLLEDSSICNETYKKRQLFRGNRDGSGRTSGSRQSSSENELKWPDHQRAWSSTDSDSSNRNLKPAMTKTASFGGITVLTRGDSTSSTRSTGRLSKAGSSESSSSAGSSGSLSRTHPPHQSAPLVSGVAASSPGCVPYPDSGMGSQVGSSSTSYILLPLEAATGIPPGSILLNPHTGQPFVNPDGSPAVYNPPSSQQPLRGAVVGPSQQPPRQQPSPQPQQQVPPPQPQMAGTLVTQSVQGLQASSQSVQYPAVSFPPPHLLPVSPTQQFPMREDVATQFSQMNLSRQSSGETPEPPPGPVYPPSLLPQPSQQPGYVIASAGQQLPAGGFSGSGPSISQQVLQAPPSPQGFVQQPPPAQMPIYYYPSGQYPTSTTQQYRPMASVPYSAQRGQQMPQTAQQAGYQPVLSGQQGFQGLMGVQQPPQSQGVMNNQPGAPVQSVMVSYPTMSSYQVPMTQGSQGLPQQSYQQPIMLPNQTGQGSLPATGMPVYCNVTPPTPQNNLRLMGPHCPSSTVPVMSASCRTNCASVSDAGWQVKF